MRDEREAIHVTERCDLLVFLGRIARSNRRIGQAERWRRRGWSGSSVAREAEAVAGALAASGVEAGDRVALYLNDGPLWHAAFFGVLRAGAIAVPLDVAFEPELLAELAAELGLAAWCTEREVPRLDLPLPRVDLDWRRPLPFGAGDLPWPPDDPDRIAE
ncbi:MAG: AMP-binding protein, partial [Candidatus Limnocylindria bacterium]